MDIHGIFKSLGLTEEHTRVYLANLEWGATIITNIARKSKIPRTTVYILIKDLQNLGLVAQELISGKTLYRAKDPEFIETLLAQKQLEIQNSISYLKQNMAELKAKQNANPNKPKVQLLEGAEGIMQAYNETLEAKSPMLIQCLTEEYEKVVPAKFMEDYFEKFFKHTNIKSKEILPVGDDDYVNKYGSEKNLQARVSISEKTETDFWVYDDKTVFVSFNQNKPYALVVEDRDIATAMRNLYELAWKEASK